MAYSSGRAAWMGRQFNISRKFISPVSARIDIPGGLAYETIDLKDASMINPVALIRTADLCYAKTISRFPFGNEPGKSLADIDDLMRDHALYVATSRVDIDMSLYEQSSPIFPLYAIKTLAYIGRSSMKTNITLHHEKMTKPYANFANQFVYIDPKKRSSKEFPEHWRKQYKQYCEGETPLTMSRLTKPEVTSQYCVDIRPSDTDLYDHTKYFSYIGYACDALYIGISKSQYNRIGTIHLRGGMKSVVISFTNESVCGNTLTIDSWEDEVQEDTVHFEYRHGDTICCQATLQFYVKN
ncbi:hypothetical protein ScPMuIL_012224 [Solemya velum]